MDEPNEAAPISEVVTSNGMSNVLPLVSYLHGPSFFLVFCYSFKYKKDAGII